MKRRDFFKVVGAGASLSVPASVKAETLPATVAELDRWMGEMFAACDGPKGPTCLPDVNQRAAEKGVAEVVDDSVMYVTYRFAKEGGHERELVESFAKEVARVVSKSPDLRGATLIWRVHPQFRVEDAGFLSAKADLPNLPSSIAGGLVSVAEAADENGDFLESMVIKKMSVLRMRFCIPSHGRALFPEADDGLVKYV